MTFHWASLLLGNLVGLPGVHEDRQSAEGFVLETHVLSKPITQRARKCPHKPASLPVIAGSDKGVVSFNSAVKPGTPVVPFGSAQGSDRPASTCALCRGGAEYPDRDVGGQSHTHMP